jgi:hypothetical protein
MPKQKATKTAKILDRVLSSFFAFFAAFCLNLQRSSRRFGNYPRLRRALFFLRLDRLFVSPALALCLLTILAATSFSRPLYRPSFFAFRAIFLY